MIASQYSGGIPDGDIYAYMNTAGNLSQTLAATFQANTDYTLTVATGWRADLPGLGFPTYPGYGIELYAGTTLIASDYSPELGGTGTGPAGDTWKDVTATYTYDPGDAGLVGQALEIRLLGGPNGIDPTYPTLAVQTNYDNVRLTAETATGSVPDIIDIAVDGSGNVVLTLDGPAAGLTVEGSDDLTEGSFQERNTAVPSGNAFTIPAADVDPNGDGKDFFRVRN